MRHRNPILFLLIFSIFSLLSTSCLKTREVEPPVSASSDWVSPTDYKILLDNLQRAVGTTNLQNYLRCFDQDTFFFYPTSQVYQGNQLLWDSWSLTDEQAWFENATANLGITSGNYLSLQETDLQTFSSDSVRYIGDYELKFQHNDTSLTTLLKGQMQLLMQLNQFNEWSIRRWTDVETHPDSSWSRLKLLYVQ